MKVYCIVPVYNTQRYVRKCIDSLLNQTYQNIEIVLVNDASTDKSGDICRKYAQLCPGRITLIDKAENEGVDRARFTALDYVVNKDSRGG